MFKKISLFFLYLIYTLFFLPLAILILLFFYAGRKISTTNLIQKLGLIPFRNEQGKEYVHVHLCSIGEWNTFFSFLERVKNHYPDILVTYFNQDLSETIKKSDLVEKYFFLPLENPVSLALFLKIYKIKFTIISEAESWPGLLFLLNFFKKKVFLTNAQMFTAEYNKYKKLNFFFKPLFNTYTTIYPTSKKFYQRFIQLGIKKEKLVLGGNFKFDTNYSKLEKKLDLEPLGKVSKNKKIIMLASFHFGEWKKVFPALQTFFFKQELKNKFTFIIAPRTLLEKKKWLSDLQREKIFMQLRSEKKKIDLKQNLFLDTYGEMFSLYKYTDLVVMGGSFIPIGGHNLLEPVSQNKKIITGPFTFHFEDIVEALEKKIIFSNADNLGKAIIENSSSGKIKQISYKETLQANQGSSKKVLTSLLKKVET